MDRYDHFQVSTVSGTIMIRPGAGTAWYLHTAVLRWQGSHAGIVQSTGQGRRPCEGIKCGGTGNFHDTATSHIVIGVKSKDTAVGELLVRLGYCIFP
jgi:hypothetical protein